MRSKVRFRFALLAPLVGAILALVAVSAPAAQASFGVESFFAANCKVEEPCTAASTEANHSELFTQAAGHPVAGVTEFSLKTHVIQTTPFTAVAPEGNAKNVRTNVAPGVSTNPEAVTKCSVANFMGKEEAPGFFTEPKCPESEIGKQIVTIVTKIPAGEPFEGDYANIELEGKLYNLEQPEGSSLSSYFGVALSLAKAGHPGLYTHTFLEGHIEWGSESSEASKVESQGTGKADYHDYYVIKNVAEGLIKSRLIFYGTKGNTGQGGFVTNPSSCSGTGLQTTTGIRLESYEGGFANSSYSGPLGTEGCNGAAPFTSVPFAPTFGLTPGAGETQSDQPDGVTAELTLPHDPSPTGIDSSQLKTASVTLPEGMTLNPSAASGLQACTPTQIGIKTKNPITCPAASKIGEVSLTVPDLPASEPLTGSLYLGGGPEPITGGSVAAPEYTVYFNAESTKYDVDVRLQGSVKPNPTTGQVTTVFSENPEQPFSNVKLKFNGGSLAPIANPLVCGTATATTSLSPFTGTAAQSPTSAFTVDSNGAGGACSSPLPFSLSQTTANQAPGTAGAKTSYTLNIARAGGQQYLSQIQTTLPAGLVGLIPAVTQCGEAEANAGTCPGSSEIGAVSVAAGAGPTPFGFNGHIYLTGPYNGAPFGLSVVVPATAGPFSLGNVVTRGTLTVNPYTARVTATTTLPTIYKGIPLRLQRVSVNINKQGFLQNPTNCGVLATETTLTSTFGATQSLSTPFQVGACGGLSFKPSFKAKTSAKTSKANGASLETTLNIGTGQTNFKSVMVQLPKQLPSRLTTLQKACPEAVFAANPFHCPSGSFVGGARANTPTLPGKLQGPAILVSHAGLAFPDLDLVMEANGVRVILVGNTKISKGITTTTFASTPDVPVSSITVNLPIGAHSAVTANGSLCINPLTMPTTLTGQNGFVVKQNTKITVASCGVRIAGKKVIGNTAYITVQTYSAGRISGSGSNLKTVYRKLGKAEKTATLKVPLSNGGLRRGRPLKVKLRVGFVPKTKSVGNSASTTTVVFG